MRGKKGKNMTPEMTMSGEYNAAIENAKLMAFSQVISRHKDASLTDLAKFAKRVGAEDLTIGDVLELPKNDAQWRAKLALPKVEQKALPPSPDRYAERIYQMLKQQGRWMSSGELRACCGGSAYQVRRALNKYIESGHVDYKGKTQGTRYKAVK